MESEDLIALVDLPPMLPTRRGRRVSVATIYRWVKRGVRGRKLSVVMIGGVAFCSPRALDDFLSGQPTSGKTTKQLPAIVDAALRAKKLK